MEEILYILSGTAEQWVEHEKRTMRPAIPSTSRWE
jgi:hypothetical protein